MIPPKQFTNCLALAGIISELWVMTTQPNKGKKIFQGVGKIL